MNIKGNNEQNEEKTHKMEESLCQISIRQRVNILNLQRVQKLNTNKTNNPMNKWENQLNKQFSKEEA
jgi:hypothetical protein